jgi:hypothetical protein
MKKAIAVAVVSLAFAAAAEPPSSSELVEKYQEPDTWANRSNFYFGTRGGVAIPQGANGLAELAGLEVGVANDSGIGFGLHALWMNNAPGAPILGVPAASWGLGALADLRYYFPTIEPLTLYPTLSAGFVAGPSAKDGTNSVLPLFNPGFGARVKLGNIYAAFEFGFAGFTIPFVALSFGYQSDRKAERAEKWAKAEASRIKALEESETSEAKILAKKREYQAAHPAPVAQPKQTEEGWAAPPSNQN